MIFPTATATPQLSGMHTIDKATVDGSTINMGTVALKRDATDKFCGRKGGHSVAVDTYGILLSGFGTVV